jgi:hypothetical protein
MFPLNISYTPVFDKIEFMNISLYAAFHFCFSAKELNTIYSTLAHTHFIPPETSSGGNLPSIQIGLHDEKHRVSFQLFDEDDREQILFDIWSAIVLTLSVRVPGRAGYKMMSLKCVYPAMLGMGNSHLPAISTNCIAIYINSTELLIVCMRFNIVCMHYGEQFASILLIWGEFSYFWGLIF